MMRSKHSGGSWIDKVKSYFASHEGKKGSAQKAGQQARKHKEEMRKHMEQIEKETGGK